MKQLQDWIRERVPLTVDVLWWALLFLIPFQARIYKCLIPLSRSWIDFHWHLPSYFEPLADFFVTDVLLLCICLFGLRREKYLMAFLGIALVSIMISEYRSYVLPYWRWTHLALATLVLCGARFWRMSLKKIAFVVVLSGVLESAVVIPQYLMQHQLGLKTLGEPTLVSHSVLWPCYFDMPKTGITSVDYILNPSKAPTCVLRAAGTLSHPNVLGGFLVFSLMMTCYLYNDRKGWYGAALVLQIVALFMTFSRGAIFAFSGAIVVWLCLHYLAEKKFLHMWKPLIVGFVCAFLLLFPQLFYRGGVVSYNAVSQQSDLLRLSMQDVALRMWADNPWFGVGYNNYLIALEKYAQGAQVEPVTVHNIYLLIAAETGLVGLAFFLIFCAVVVYRGWQQRASVEGQMLLALFLAYLAIGCVDYYPLLSQQTRLIFFLAAGLLSRREIFANRGVRDLSHIHP